MAAMHLAPSAPDTVSLPPLLCSDANKCHRMLLMASGDHQKNHHLGRMESDTFEWRSPSAMMDLTLHAHAVMNDRFVRLSRL